VNLTGTTTLLTGATGGIGDAIARRLHRAGSRLVLTGRRTDVLEPLAAELGAESIAVDLADRDDLRRLAAHCAHVDVVVANAALPASGALSSFTEEEIDKALEVNLHAPIHLAHLLIPGMLARGRGHFVMISSLAGKASTPGSSIYSATKFGLRGFGQGLRGDLQNTGVGASVVFPGFIRDAGMFAETEIELPSFVGTSTPDDVAEGVIRAIERDKGEVDVAPLGMRAGAAFGGLAPATAAKLARRMGSDDISGELGQRQTAKRL
jgi:short-subunit dehydrogenase